MEGKAKRGSTAKIITQVEGETIEYTDKLSIKKTLQQPARVNAMLQKGEVNFYQGDIYKILGTMVRVKTSNKFLIGATHR